MLDTENRFTIDLTKTNSIEQIKFSLCRNYFVASLKVNVKIGTDKTKWSMNSSKLSEFSRALNKSDKKWNYTQLDTDKKINW